MASQVVWPGVCPTYANVAAVMTDATVRKVTDIKGITEGGYRLLINTGEDASQSVKHFHVHVLGGHKMPRPNDQDWSAEANQ